MPDVVRGRVFQILVGNPPQVVGACEQILVERAQHVQHAHRLLAARVERVDLHTLDRRAAAFGQRDERVVP
ncbi:hypothetical protein KPA97_66165, partial [Burkholderia cenocepacia]|nr:hypothetical protein [Burkholderia cenocepacia]MDR5670882.1 hypothetical protein [Burkholderia cenocepacia]